MHDVFDTESRGWGAHGATKRVGTYMSGERGGSTRVNEPGRPPRDTDAAPGAVAVATRAPIRVFVAEDQDAVRLWLVALISRHPGLEVIGEAEDGEAAVADVLRLHPDVVLMDIAMPVLDGLSATHRITQAMPAARVVILTAYEDQDHLLSAVANGAVGFVPKHAGSRMIYDAVEAAASGEALVSPSLTVHLLQALRRRSDSAAEGPSLTSRERDVVSALARGLTNTEIAADLFISLGTVKAHLTNVQTKLGMRNRVEIATWAWRTGLLEADSA